MESFYDESVHEQAKTKAQVEAWKTEPEPKERKDKSRGLTTLPWSRGGTAYVWEIPDRYLAATVEILGTKSHDARMMYELTGVSFEGNIAQDNLAMAWNDVAAKGARDFITHLVLCVESVQWFWNEERCAALLSRMRELCVQHECVWGGGETAVLAPIIQPEEVFLSCSAVGQIVPKERLIDEWSISPGDAIFFVLGSGIHANGLTIARSIADSPRWRRALLKIFPFFERKKIRALPRGYLTVLSDKRTFGETLLDPTPIALPIVQGMLDCGIRVCAFFPMTGGAYEEKIMRIDKPFTYVIEKIPNPPPEIFQVIQDYTRADDRFMCSHFNMGVLSVVVVAEEHADKTAEFFARKHIPALRAGHVELSGNPNEKRVVIRPKGIEYRKEILFLNPGFRKE